MKASLLTLVGALAVFNGAFALYVDRSQIPVICSEEDSDDLLFPHEECNKYYQCSYGKVEVRTCPINLVYNPDKQYCDWLENVDCSRAPEIPVIPEIPETENPGNNDPSQAKEICAAEGSDGILIAHEECNKFYICTENRPMAIDCPLNLLYNPVNEQCDWPENVNCQRTPVAPESPVNESENNNSGGNKDPSQATEICAADGSDGTLVVHEDCNKFYMCAENRPLTIDCPLNLMYNPDKLQCDWPENVNCDRTPVAPEPPVDENENNGGGNGDPSQAAEICAAEGSDGVLIAHEECNKFYKCSENIPHEIECPLNLLYNAEKQYCDWPENVQC